MMAATVMWGRREGPWLLSEHRTFLRGEENVLKVEET